MTCAVRVVDVGGPDFDTFLDLSRRIEGSSEGRAATEAALSPSSPFFRHGRATLLLGTDELGEAVGRVVASVDDDFPDPAVGHFGFFACIPGQQVATALLDAASAWLLAQGKTRMQGPTELSVWHGYRFMTKGFHTTPFPVEPRNPAWYPDLIRGYGFEPIHRWRSWQLSPLALRLVRWSHWLAKRSLLTRLARAGYRNTMLEGSGLLERVDEIHPLVQQSFQGHAGVAPVDLEEYSRLVGAFLAGGRVHGVLVHHPSSDAAVAFGYSFIDARDRIVLHSMGVAREHRGVGLAHQVLHAAFEVARRQRVRGGVAALAKEGPTIFDAVGAPDRRYALFSVGLEGMA